MRPACHRRRRWASFAGVGVLGFGVQLAVLGFLTAGAGLPTAPAAAMAVETAVLHNFVWHERWTWCDRVGGRAGGGPARALGRLLRIHAGAGIVSLAGNVAITVFLVEWLHVPVVLANACAVGVPSVLNFLLADRWVFAGSPSSSAGDEPSSGADAFRTSGEQG